MVFWTSPSIWVHIQGMDCCLRLLQTHRAPYVPSLKQKRKPIGLTRFGIGFEISLRIVQRLPNRRRLKICDRHSHVRSLWSRLKFFVWFCRVRELEGEIAVLRTEGDLSANQVDQIRATLAEAETTLANSRTETAKISNELQEKSEALAQALLKEEDLMAAHEQSIQQLREAGYQVGSLNQELLELKESNNGLNEVLICTYLYLYS